MVWAILWYFQWIIEGWQIVRPGSESFDQMPNIELLFFDIFEKLFWRIHTLSAWFVGAGILIITVGVVGEEILDGNKLLEKSLFESISFF